MNKLRFKPSNWWYLPPGIAGGFFFLVTALFNPMGFFWGLLIPLTFLAISFPVGVLTYFFTCSVAIKSLHKEETEAKKWGLIAVAWVSVIAMYVQAEYFWCELIGC